MQQTDTEFNICRLLSHARVMISSLDYAMEPKMINVTLEVHRNPVAASARAKTK